MLTVYTRHSQKCPHKDDIAWRRCRCPKWIQGPPSEDHEFLRSSAATRTWEQAEEKARKLEEEARPGARKTAPAIRIEEAGSGPQPEQTTKGFVDEQEVFSNRRMSLGKRLDGGGGSSFQV